MPANIKTIVSIITLIVGAIFYYFESRYGQLNVAWVGVFLSVFMVISMWIFPEAGNQRKG